MEAGKQNLIVNKKASFRYDFYVFDTYNEKLAPDAAGQGWVDLTGCTIAAKAKAKIDDTSPLFTFTASIPEPTKGHCRLELSAAQTASMVWTKGVWDCLVTFPDGTVQKYLEGQIVLEKAVT
jgi:hypothetical protein